jgi:hypothetical protein
MTGGLLDTKLEYESSRDAPSTVRLGDHGARRAWKLLFSLHHITASLCVLCTVHIKRAHIRMGLSVHPHVSSIESLYGLKISIFYLLATCLMLVFCLAYSSTLKMEATYSSETSVDFVLFQKIELFITTAARTSDFRLYGFLMEFDMQIVLLEVNL